MKFVDLFAGLGGFHKALNTLGHDCVLASEIDSELREIYADNFPDISKNRILGDIRKCKDEIPSHDILCAGFPCQPFSKSGTQKGLKDKTRGTLFHEIVDVLERCRPEYVILENVGNFERHDEGRTWKIVRESLEKLSYDVQGTEHVTSGGAGLLSPHHFGFPHSRERFYIVARQGKLPSESLPKGDRSCVTNLDDTIQKKLELHKRDRIETKLTAQQSDCIDHWNKLLAKLPEGQVELPSFPIWGDEFQATYPFETYTPFIAPIKELRTAVNGHAALSRITREELLVLLPNYARHEVEEFPRWKVDFIRQNREWFKKHRKYFGTRWLKKLREFPPSLRKLEWNCRGEERDLWRHVLQFRPSGLRVKRYSACPSLVAMTSTQIPLLGPERRFLTRVEGLRLQGFPDTHAIPQSRAKTFQALGNAVHVGVVTAIADSLLNRKTIR
ncbi:MAG TPA: DNA (cytosine-5-)-methyltransferase [Pyrinomonadaceae bacterium]|nr:DNA (cytosine-5-)-methyltransferase [Pyrinomonadaceae bacterium]